MDYFYNRCLHVYDGFADAPGYRTVKTIKAGILGQVGDQAALRREGLKWKDFIDQGYVIAGSPKTVRERLREAMKSLNCGHLMMLMQLGSMPPELVQQEHRAVRARVHAVSARPVERLRRQMVGETDARVRARDSRAGATSSSRCRSIPMAMRAPTAPAPRHGVRSK